MYKQTTGDYIVYLDRSTSARPTYDVESTAPSGNLASIMKNAIVVTAIHYLEDAEGPEEGDGGGAEGQSPPSILPPTSRPAR